ncbi:hypothetical protein ACXYMU_10080 [Pontibacter sp. CAU 1760]
MFAKFAESASKLCIRAASEQLGKQDTAIEDSNLTEGKVKPCFNKGDNQLFSPDNAEPKCCVSIGGYSFFTGSRGINRYLRSIKQIKPIVKNIKLLFSSSYLLQLLFP